MASVAQSTGTLSAIDGEEVSAGHAKRRRLRKLSGTPPAALPAGQSTDVAIAECNENNNRHSAGPCVAAAMANYGSGWPGTNGVPSLTLDALPQLGTTRSILIGNSLALPTSAVLAIGVATASIPSGFGGLLLVDPFMLPLVPLVPLAAGTTPISFVVPCTVEFCGARLFLQALEIDRGASQLLSFSRGLSLTFGR